MDSLKKIQYKQRCGSSDYEYCNDSMKYHDTYFGGVNFIGEEAVYTALRLALILVGTYFCQRPQRVYKWLLQVYF